MTDVIYDEEENKFLIDSFPINAHDVTSGALDAW